MANPELIETKDLQVTSKDMPFTSASINVPKDKIQSEMEGISRIWTNSKDSSTESHITYPKNDIRAEVQNRLYNYDLTKGNDDLREIDKGVSELLKDFDPQVKQYNGKDIVYSKRQGVLTESTTKSILEHDLKRPLTKAESDHVSELFGIKPAPEQIKEAGKEVKAQPSYMDQVRHQKAVFESYANTIIDTNKNLTEDQIVQKILDAQNEEQRKRNAFRGVSNQEAGVRTELSKSERDTITKLFELKAR